MDGSTHPEQYLDAAAMADRYNVHKQTIWRWNAEGRLPPSVKLGPGSTRWRLSALEAWERRAEGAAA
jgi:predicted DNA-binding transcriptional regulator AlpA